MKVLMESHPELSMTVDPSNTTALHTAAIQGHTEIVRFLLEAGSSLATIARSNGKTALHSAARNGHVVVVKAILEKEPGVATRTDKKGQTALHMAAKGQKLEMVEELIKADPSSINMVDSKGNTALHIATRKGRSKVKTRPPLVIISTKIFCRLHVCIMLWCQVDSNLDHHPSSGWMFFVCVCDLSFHVWKNYLLIAPAISLNDLLSQLIRNGCLYAF